jgi:hypothetical protein
MIDAVVVGWFIAAAIALPVAVWLIVDSYRQERYQRRLRAHLARVEQDMRHDSHVARLDALTGAMVLALLASGAAAIVRRWLR